MKNGSKASRQAKVQKIVAAMSKFYGTQPVSLAGTTFSRAALQKLLQADVASSDAVDQARAVWLKAVEAQKASRTQTNPVLRAIRNKVLGDHGDSRDAGEVLAEFGIAPRSTRKATSEEQVAAAKKRTATREARHTLGSKERSKIDGTTVAVNNGAESTPAASPAPHPAGAP